MIRTHFQSITDRRLAALALASRWYGAEHQGKLPTTAEELVSSYLPGIPDDAMGAGNRIAYVPSRKMVYSVGENGIDDGGSETLAKERPESSRWDFRDAIVHLDRQPKRYRETTEAERKQWEADGVMPWGTINYVWISATQPAVRDAR